MQVVDHYDVGVVLAMLDQMRVPRWKVWVVMREDWLVVRGPQVPNGSKARRSDHSQSNCGR